MIIEEVLAVFPYHLASSGMTLEWRCIVFHEERGRTERGVLTRSLALKRFFLGALYMGRHQDVRGSRNRCATDDTPGALFSEQF